MKSSARNIVTASTAAPATLLRPGRLAVAALALAAAMGMCGCGLGPELAIYREGLHAVDEPLYQAHLQLMDQAIAAGTRSETDRQTVKAGIQAARLLYEESRKAAN